PAATRAGRRRVRPAVRRRPLLRHHARDHDGCRRPRRGPRTDPDARPLRPQARDGGCLDVRRLACVLLLVAAALPLAAGAGVDRSVSFLLARQQADGGFAEPGRQSTSGLSAWAVLALAAAGRQPSAAALAYLRTQS